MALTVQLPGVCSFLPLYLRGSQEGEQGQLFLMPSHVPLVLLLRLENILLVATEWARHSLCDVERLCRELDQGVQVGSCRRDGAPMDFDQVLFARREQFKRRAAAEETRVDLPVVSPHVCHPLVAPQELQPPRYAVSLEANMRL